MERELGISCVSILLDVMQQIQPDECQVLYQMLVSADTFLAKLHQRGFKANVLSQLQSFFKYLT